MDIQVTIVLTNRLFITYGILAGLVKGLGAMIGAVMPNLFKKGGCFKGKFSLLFLRDSYLNLTLIFC